MIASRENEVGLVELVPPFIWYEGAARLGRLKSALHGRELAPVGDAFILPALSALPSFEF